MEFEIEAWEAAWERAAELRNQPDELATLVLEEAGFSATPEILSKLRKMDFGSQIDWFNEAAWTRQ